MVYCYQKCLTHMHRLLLFLMFRIFSAVKVCHERHTLGCTLLAFLQLWIVMEIHQRSLTLRCQSQSTLLVKMPIPCRATRSSSSSLPFPGQWSVRLRDGYEGCSDAQRSVFLRRLLSYKCCLLALHYRCWV